MDRNFNYQRNYNSNNQYNPRFSKGPNTGHYVFQPRPAPPVYQATEFDGKRLRKAIARKTVDYNTSVVKMLEARVWQRSRDRRLLQPDVGYYTEVSADATPGPIP